VDGVRVDDYGVFTGKWRWRMTGYWCKSLPVRFNGDGEGKEIVVLIVVAAVAVIVKRDETHSNAQVP
jgi:hypothetical protein